MEIAGDALNVEIAGDAAGAVVGQPLLDEEEVQPLSHVQKQEMSIKYFFPN